MTTLTQEEINELNAVECPMDDIGFDPEYIDERGDLEATIDESVEGTVEEEAEALTEE